MSYNLSVDKEYGCIRIELHDELTQTDIDEVLEKILTIRKEHNVKNILCDQRNLETAPNDVVVFETAERFAGGSFVGMKLAIVRASIPDDHFFATTANNRAGIVRIFDDDETAEQWLYNHVR